MIEVRSCLLIVESKQKPMHFLQNALLLRYETAKVLYNEFIFSEVARFQRETLNL